MVAIAYSETFGDPGHEQFFRQLRACGIPLVTHDYRNPDRFPYENVEVVELRSSVVDQVVAGVRRLRTRHGFRLPMSAEIRLMDRLLQLRATTVHAHGGVAGACVAPVARRLGCRLLVTFHDGDTPQRAGGAYGRALRELFFASARVLASTRGVARRLADFGCPDEKLEILPFGVALRPMRPRRPGTRGVPIRAITTVPLHPANGVADLVDAVALARRMGAPVTLDIVGDGPDRDKVARRIERSGLGPTIRMHGDLDIEQTRRLLDASDVFVLNRTPTHGEDLPAPVLEAMASGLCVVATKTGSVAEAVRDHVTGMLLDGPDVSGLATTLARAAKDGGLRVALGAAGRAHVERDFDLARGVERLYELYQ